MKIGMVGLGRMGGNMSLRLIRNGHGVVGHSRSDGTRRRAAEGGVETVGELADLVAALDPPRSVWMMVPAGDATESVLGELRDLLEPGDLAIDGGNSLFRDSIRRAAELRAGDISFLDVGVSGGVWGLEEGYCLMLGGEQASVERLRPVLDALAPPGGWAHVGPAGAGHFVKMVHNGIEYGLLQAYGEGFEILRSSLYDLDLHRVAEVWRHGSVVRSWLLDLLARALESEPDLASVAGYVEDSGEGRWTVLTAIDQEVPAPATALSLFARFASRQDESFSAKVIAALRREFGGHDVREDPSP